MNYRTSLELKSSPSRRTSRHEAVRLACRAILPAILLAGASTGCSSAVGDEAVDESTSDLSVTQKGVDYSSARPSPSGLASAGYTFAARYLSWSTSGKNLTLSEAKSLHAAGVHIVSNWEYDTQDALGGYSAGVKSATEAQKQAAADGAPHDRPIYFSVDFDATPQQQSAINSYFDGVASVIGRDRVGAYGGYYVIKRLFDAGKIHWGWQAFAWSGGQWDSRAQLRQVKNNVNIAGGACDIDNAVAADFGQWDPTDGSSDNGGGGSCGVESDKKLHCSNTAGAAMHSDTRSSSAVVNHLQSTNSWFQCWGTGELHAGGNTTWYYTLGDDNSNWGWVPAVDLDTTSSFDANPTAHGLTHCGGSSASLPANCDIHSDGKLYCDNTNGASIHSAAKLSSSVVNHMRTTSSWFQCWGTGDMHAGGNTTWYYTVGDDNGTWGWVPAVDLSTPSYFDANPSSYGLKLCD